MHKGIIFCLGWHVFYNLFCDVQEGWLSIIFCVNFMFNEVFPRVKTNDNMSLRHTLYVRMQIMDASQHHHFRTVITPACLCMLSPSSTSQNLLSKSTKVLKPSDSQASSPNDKIQNKWISVAQKRVSSASTSLSPSGCEYVGAGEAM